MSTLLVTGARSIAFCRAADGQRGTLQLLTSTPLERLLRGPRPSEPLDQFTDRVRLEPGPHRRLQLLSYTAQNVAFVREQMLGEQCAALRSMVQGLCEDFAELKRVFKQATGHVLARKNDFAYVTADELLAMFELVAGEIAEEEGSGLTGEAAFWRLATAADVAKPGPWRDLDWVCEQIGLLLDYEAAADGTAFYGPKAPAGGAVALDVMVEAATDRWQRMVVVGDGAAGRYAAALVEGDSPDALRRPAAGQMQTQSFAGRGALIDWLADRAGGRELQDASRWGVQDMTVTVDGVGSLEQVLARLEAESDCGFARTVGKVGEQLVSTGVSYSGQSSLRRRAAELGVRGRTVMDEDELREVIAREAMRVAPPAAFAPDAGGMFLRDVRYDDAGTPAVRRSLAELESLTCHALGGRFMHAGMDGVTVRLQESLSFVDAVAPLNVFAR